MLARKLTKYVECLNEAQSFHFSEEIDHVSMLAAAEAIEPLISRIDYEGWFVIIVERTPANVVPSTRADDEVPSDKLFDVDQGLQMLDLTA